VLFIRLLRLASSISFSLSVLSWELLMLMSDLMFSRTSLLSAKFPLARARSKVRTANFFFSTLLKIRQQKTHFAPPRRCSVASNHRCPAGVSCSCVAWTGYIRQLSSESELDSPKIMKVSISLTCSSWWQRTFWFTFSPWREGTESRSDVKLSLMCCRKMCGLS
jgi:hypothetical protein